MPYAYSTTTCQVLDATTTECVSVQSTSTPMFVQDSGGVQYMLAWLIFFATMMFLGMIWNVMPFSKHGI